MRVHVNVALDALLPHVGPGVAAHPFSLALGTLVLAEAALFALVRGQTLAFGACLEDRKQTQGIGVHQATIMPPQIPTASPFSPHALCPEVQTQGHLLSQVQRTPVTPEHTWESQGWETHGNEGQSWWWVFRVKEESTCWWRGITPLTPLS